MPIYEYVCRECGEEVEKLQRLSDDPLTDCPACGQPALKRKISAAGFRLAGGGWYETDFKSDGKRNLAGDSGGAKSSASNSDSKAGDSGSSKSESAKTSAAGKDSGKPAAKAKNDSKPASGASTAS
ncbi:zinc ribbon domain-containing protein [Salinisphaera sp. T31B1]|uniref:FmdB family zinc ribbon protein n=1 Tax=Salinisphaera sp. T31B1 TaxID=727963 RepID=UPI00333F9966